MGRNTLSFWEQLKVVYLYKDSLLEGLLLTTELSLLALIFALCLGLAAAVGSFSRFKMIRLAVLGYTSFIRGVPDIVLIFLFYYGIQEGLNSVTTYFNTDIIHLNSFLVSVFVIALIFGAFMAETFRGALLAVKRGQKEAALALGMNQRQIYFRIIFPQMMRYAIPGISNNWLVLLKATALVSLVNIHDFVFIAKSAGSSSRLPFTFSLAACVGFLIFTSISLFVIKKIEAYFSKGISYSEVRYE